MADGKVVIDVELEDGKVARGVSNVDRRLRGLEGAGRAGAFGIKEIVTALGLVAAGAKVFDMIRDSIRTAFGRIDAMERFHSTMTTITGSSEKARQALDRVTEIVKGTAYSLDVAALSTQNFVTRGVEIGKATKYVEAWGDAVAFYGDGSNETFRNVTDAIGKMLTTGKVHMDQLNRLFDAGIPAVDMYAQATGMSAAEVQEALSKGEISAEQFIDTVTDAMMEGTGGVVKIAGAAKEAGTSWSAVFDNMRIAVARGVAEIIMKIDEMLVKNGLPDMRTMVKNFGEQFENVLTGIANKIPAIINWIVAVKNALEPWAPLILGVVTAAASFATIVGVVNSVKNAFTAARTAVMIFNATLMANPYAAAIAVIIGLAVVIYTYWDEIKAFTIATWNAIKAFFSSIWNAIKAVFTAALGPIASLVVKNFNVMKTTIDSALTAAKKIVGAVWDWIKNSFKNALQFIKSLVTLDFQGMKNAIQNQMNNSKSLISTVWNAIKSFFSSVLASILSNVSSQFANIVNAARDRMNAVKDRIRSIWESIKSYLKGINLYSIGRDIINGLLRGISAMAGSVFKKAQEIASGITSRIKKALRIASPSKVMIELGEFTGEGLEVGMDKSVRDILKQAQALANAAVPEINPTSFQPAMLAAAGAGGAQGGIGDIIITGNNFHIREEADINRISRAMMRQAIEYQRGPGRRF